MNFPISEFGNILNSVFEGFSMVETGYRANQDVANKSGCEQKQCKF